MARHSHTTGLGKRTGLLMTAGVVGLIVAAGHGMAAPTPDTTDGALSVGPGASAPAYPTVENADLPGHRSRPAIEPATSSLATESCFLVSRELVVACI